MQRRAFLATTAAAAIASPALAAEPHVLPGDDVFVAETWRELAGRTIGIVTNQSGVLSDGTSFVVICATPLVTGTLWAMKYPNCALFAFSTKSTEPFTGGPPA